ncbi:MAG: AI-2E family transporter [Verrucomicrobiota bacterium JB022]|nr:AI-2E family transporter [Verrucomicrobiota bacterium JB022]
MSSEPAIPRPPLLSPWQRRLVGIALALLAVALIATFFTGIFLLLRAFVQTFSSVLWPLAAAGILALVLRPLALSLQRRLKAGRITVIVIIYLLILLLTSALIGLVLPEIIRQTVAFADFLPQILDNARAFLARHYPQVSAFLQENVDRELATKLATSLGDYAGQLARLTFPAVNQLGTWLGSIFGLLAGIAIIPVYLFFFLKTDRDPGADLDDQLSFIRQDWREDAIFLLREFANSMVAFFRGQLVIGLIMGVLMGTGFSIAGVKFGLVLGLLAGILNIIPYFGTIIGLGTVLPTAFFQPDGGIALVGIALGIFVAVQMLEGYVLTPRIMGETTGLHPLTIIIAIFFWGVALNGLLGMVLAIPLTAFFVVAWRLIKRKYLQPHHQAPTNRPPPEEIVQP